MLYFVLFILILTTSAFCVDLPPGTNSKQTITIMASQAKPYVYAQTKSLKGLDVDIMENFAKRQNLKIDYIIADQPLKEVFCSEDRFYNFSQTIEFS